MSFYKKQAETYESQLKRNNAVKTYERLLQMKLLDSERSEIMDKLLKLYERLGKMREIERHNYNERN